MATQSRRASVKFCLKNIQANKEKCWTLILTGETILALEANLRASMAVHIGTFQRVTFLLCVKHFFVDKLHGICFC